MREYKVLTQKDRWFGGKFEPLKIEQALNSLAAEGWHLVAATTAEFPAMMSKRDEMIMILERERPA